MFKERSLTETYTKDTLSYFSIFFLCIAPTVTQLAILVFVNDDFP